MSKIRAIHPFGPPVGKFTLHGTVPETIARERRRLEESAKKQREADKEAVQKVQPFNQGENLEIQTQAGQQGYR